LVQAQLLTDVSTVKPGEPFTIGVLLHISPGWHIYWINPGDSGLATSVRFTLPDGFVAGPLQFPVPRRLEQPGNVVNFGYEDEVMLTARVMPPGNLKVGDDLTFIAQTKVLCCKEVCLPASATAQLTLKAASETKPAGSAIFQFWEAQIPSAAPTDIAKSSVELTPAGQGTIKIEWTHPPKDIQLFPGPSEALAVSDISIRPDGNASTLSFTLTHLSGFELKESLYPMVVGYTNSQGDRRGLLVNVPLTQLKAAGPKQ
jgi:DsbC/DsbD-like thiol-disulfide interchange protein